MTFPPYRIVLVVDDEAQVRVHASTLLSQQGCFVVVAANAEDAYRLVERHEPDVVLLDAELPGLDIEDFHARVRLARFSAKFFLTSRSPQPGRDGIGLITKPFRKKALIEALSACNW
jgi:CheY-like chemotaxis protein